MTFSLFYSPFPEIFANFVGLYRGNLVRPFFMDGSLVFRVKTGSERLTEKWYGITIKSLRYKEKSSLLYKEISVHSARTDIRSA